MIAKKDLKRIIQDFGRLLRPIGLEIIQYFKAFPINNPLDPRGVEILADEKFQASCVAVRKYTLLDTARLANLWMLCRDTDEAGAILEIGSYQGGGALHLSNCAPQRRLIVCDPFSSESFSELVKSVDGSFQEGMFADSSEESVKQLLKDRNSYVIKGYFPYSVHNIDLPKISFVHLDVDVYKATKESLLHLINGDFLLPNHLIVLDDYNRRADGVNLAVKEVLAMTKSHRVLPIFPGQAVLVPR